MIRAGLYPRDAAGTCYPQETNAETLDAAPSRASLEAFVQCAASRLEADGYADKAELEGDSRWRSGSVYVLGLDLQGNEVLNGKSRAGRCAADSHMRA